MKFLRRIGGIYYGTVDVFAFMAGVLIIYLMLSVSAEVVMRYFLNRPTMWVIDVATIVLLNFTFLGAAWLLKREGHVKMDLVINRFNPLAQTVINITTSLFGAIVCVGLTWYGAKVTLEHFTSGIFQPTALELPSHLTLFMIPIGSFLLFIQFLIRTYGYFRRGQLQERHLA